MAIEFTSSVSYGLQGDGSSASITVNTPFGPTAVTDAQVYGGPGGISISSTSFNTLLKQITVNFTSAPPAGSSNQFNIIVKYLTTDTRTLIGSVFAINI